MVEGSWYYATGSGAVGPESTTALLEQLESGSLTLETLIWRDGETDWLPLQRALGLQDNHPPPVPGIPSGTRPDGVGDAKKGPSRSKSWSAAVSGYEDIEPHPWRRYFARMLDTILGGAALWFAFGILFSAADQDAAHRFFSYVNSPDGSLLNSMATVAFAIAPNAAFIGFTRSSVGKLIFGIRVSNFDGSPLGFGKALKREALVWVRGFGLAIPLVSLITLITAYKNLNTNRTASWDKDLFVRVSQRKQTSIQMVLNVIGVIAWLAIAIAIIGLGRG